MRKAACKGRLSGHSFVLCALFDISKSRAAIRCQGNGGQRGMRRVTGALCHVLFLALLLRASIQHKHEMHHSSTALLFTGLLKLRFPHRPPVLSLSPGLFALFTHSAILSPCVPHLLAPLNA